MKCICPPWYDRLCVECPPFSKFNGSECQCDQNYVKI
jgi:hypothetical protein